MNTHYIQADLSPHSRVESAMRLSNMNGSSLRTDDISESAAVVSRYTVFNYKGYGGRVVGVHYVQKSNLREQIKLLRDHPSNEHF